MDDLPYQPVDRDRQAERARAEKLPGYTEARKMTPEQRNKYIELMAEKEYECMDHKDIEGILIAYFITDLSKLNDADILLELEENHPDLLEQYPLEENV